MIRRLLVFILALSLNLSALAQNIPGAGGPMLPVGQPTLGPNGYAVGNWVTPKGPVAVSAGAAPGSGSIKCYDGYVSRTYTTAALGIRLTTLSVGGNVQAAIYANSAAGRPTGTALVSTSSMSTTTLTGVSSAAVLQLQADTIYWLCSNMDNGTAIAAAVSGTSLGHDQLVGDTTLNNLITGGGSAGIGVSTAQTFGTWPDLTSATWAIVTTVTIPLIITNIGSIP